MTPIQLDLDDTQSFRDLLEYVKSLVETHDNLVEFYLVNLTWPEEKLAKLILFMDNAGIEYSIADK